MEIKLEYKHPIGNVRQVKLDNGEVWNLTGECNRCGECCEKLKSPDFNVEGKMGCKHLFFETVDGEKKACCEILYKRPSAMCVLYPSDPYDPLYPSCSYKWEKVDG